MLRNAIQKAQDRKEINSNLDARRISFDLNGTLIAGYWTYLAEKNEKVFAETRSALLAKMKRLATARIQDYAFKSENAWKEYLEPRHMYKEEPPNILRVWEHKRHNSLTFLRLQLLPNRSSPQRSPEASSTV
jgi:hypothetical protein